MLDPISYHQAVRSAHELAGSALPNAPVVDVDDVHAPVRTSRRWTAARLRTFARATYRLADGVDPVRLHTATG